MAGTGSANGSDDGKGDKGAQEPNLELPSLSLGLRRKKKNAKSTEDEGATSPQAATEPTGATTAPPKPAVQPPAPSTTAPVPPGKKNSAAPARKVAPAPPPAAKKAAPAPPTPAVGPVPPAPAPKAPAAPQATAAPRPPAPRPEAAKPSSPVPAAPAAPSAPAAVPDPSGGDEVAEVPKEPKEPSKLVAFFGKLDDLEIQLPRVAPHVAAIVSGIVCGLVAVLLGWLSASGCQAVRGVGTCGGFGLVALIAIIAIEVILGGTLLRSWGINEPTSTAFLGVGLVAVAAMLFFLGSIGSVWMILVIPLLTAAMFLLSWWITDTVIDIDE